MRIATCLATVVVGGMLLCGSAPGDESSYRAKLSYSELIGYGLVSTYSTNVLVESAFAGGCLTKAEALVAVERNLAFVKVLERYTLSLKRGSAKEDEGMKKLIGDMCDVTTYLEQQTKSLKDWIDNPGSKSAKMAYERYSSKVEERMELMLGR